MLRRVALVRTDVSEEISASFIRVTRISELETKLAVASNRRTLRRNNIWEPYGFRNNRRPSETSVLTRSTRHNIPEDGFVHSHRREHLKYYNMKLCVESCVFVYCLLIVPLPRVKSHLQFEISNGNIVTNLEFVVNRVRLGESLRLLPFPLSVVSLSAATNSLVMNSLTL
jgi:hypothetical protein